MPPIEGMEPGDTLAVSKPASQPLLADLSACFHSIIVAVGSSGMPVAAIVGILLDNLIPGTQEKRGLQIPSLIVPEAGDLGGD